MRCVDTTPYAVLTPDAVTLQAFASPQLLLWSERMSAWDAPVQAHAALSEEGTVCCIFVVPGRIIEAAVRAMEEQQSLRMMDMCCQAASLRHISLARLAGLVKHSVVCARLLTMLVTLCLLDIPDHTWCCLIVFVSLL